MSAVQAKTKRVPFRITYLKLKFTLNSRHDTNKWHLSSQVKGVLIIKIEPESVGDDSGLVMGEVITEVNQKEIQSPRDFIEKIDQVKKNGHKNVMLSVIGKHGLYHLSLGIEE